MSLIRPDSDGSRRALPTHAQALETYWRQLELTPHQAIGCESQDDGLVRIDAMSLHGRISLYRQGLETGPVAWLGPIPVGGQGLTDNERTWCRLAGLAMAAIFAEEAAK